VVVEGIVLGEATLRVLAMDAVTSDFFTSNLFLRFAVPLLVRGAQGANCGQGHDSETGRSRVTALDRGCVKTRGPSMMQCIFGHVGSISCECIASNRALPNNLHGMLFLFSRGPGSERDSRVHRDPLPALTTRVQATRDPWNWARNGVTDLASFPEQSGADFAERLGANVAAISRDPFATKLSPVRTN
jgi:hypothetical protein